MSYEFISHFDIHEQRSIGHTIVNMLNLFTVGTRCVGYV